MNIEQKNPSTSPDDLLREISSTRQHITIGIPRENIDSEHRLALTPEAVAMISASGGRVLIEEGAGEGIFYSDMAFSEAGAEISDRKTVLGSDLILQIAPPPPQSIAFMKKRATIFHSLQLSNMSAAALNTMAEKSLNVVAYELITADEKDYPVRNIFSEAEGAVAVSIASGLLTNANGGKGIVLGGFPGVTPTEIVIIGAGAAATVAARTLLSMGASVKVFDNDISKLRRLQSETGSQIFTSILLPKALQNAFRSADIVIGAMRYIDDNVRYIVPAETTALLKNGAIVIDLRVGLGGCFEETCMLPGDSEKFVQRGVTYYCKPNLSSYVARSVAMSMSNVLLPFLTELTDNAALNEAVNRIHFLRSGHYMYAGKMVNRFVAKHFNLPSHDIGLFMSSY